MKSLTLVFPDRHVEIYSLRGHLRADLAMIRGGLDVGFRLAAAIGWDNFHHVSHEQASFQTYRIREVWQLWRIRHN